MEYNNKNKLKSILLVVMGGIVVFFCGVHLLATLILLFFEICKVIVTLGMMEMDQSVVVDALLSGGGVVVGVALFAWGARLAERRK